MGSCLTLANSRKSKYSQQTLTPDYHAEQAKDIKFSIPRVNIPDLNAPKQKASYNPKKEHPSALGDFLVNQSPVFFSRNSSQGINENDIKEYRADFIECNAGSDFIDEGHVPDVPLTKNAQFNFEITDYCDVGKNEEEEARALDHVNLEIIKFDYTSRLADTARLSQRQRERDCESVIKIKAPLANLNNNSNILVENIEELAHFYGPMTAVRGRFGLTYITNTEPSKEIVLIVIIEHRLYKENYENDLIKLLDGLTRDLKIDFGHSRNKFLTRIISKKKLYFLKFKRFGPPQYVFLEFKIADFSLEYQLKIKASLNQSFTQIEIKKIFLDIISSIFYMNIKDSFPAELTLNHVLYNVEMDKYFCIEAESTSDGAPEKSLFGDVLSLIHVHQEKDSFLETHPLIIFDQKEEKENFRERKVSEISIINLVAWNYYQEEAKESDSFSLDDDISGLRHSQSYYNELKNNPLATNVESLGRLLLKIFRKNKFHNNIQITKMNEEAFFAFNENFYLDLNNLTLHKAKNNFRFFLDSDYSNRMDILSLAHFLDLDVLHNNIHYACQEGYIKVDVLKKGQVEIKYSSGYAYKGEAKLDPFSTKIKTYVRNGEGTLYSPEREIVYTGHWQNDLFHGHGQLILEKNNCVYRGGFQQGRCHGHGLLEYKGKRHFQGFFNNNNFFYDVYEESEESAVLEEEVRWKSGIHGYFAFEGPIKFKKKDRSMNLLNITYIEQDLDMLELNFISIIYDEFTIRRIGNWLKNYLHNETMHFLLKFNNFLQIWQLEGYLASSLKLRLIVYLSEKNLDLKKTFEVISCLEYLTEDFTVKISKTLISSQLAMEFFDKIVESPKLCGFLKRIYLKRQQQHSHSYLLNFFKRGLLDNLRKLDLNCTNISDELMDIIANSPRSKSLEILSVRGCTSLSAQFIFSLIQSMHIVNLHVLDLSGTMVNDEGIASLGKAKFSDILIKLNVSECFKVTSNGFISFFSKNLPFPQLKKLYLNWTDFNQQAWLKLLESSNFPNLKKLKIKRCPLFSIILPSFKDLKIHQDRLALKKIDFSKTGLDGNQLAFICTKLSRISSLLINDCDGLKFLDNTICSALTSLPNLTKLEISHTYLNKNFVTIANENRLKKLNISNCRVLDENDIVLFLEQNKDLKVLKMSFSNISDFTFLSLLKKGNDFTELLELDIEGTPVTDAVLDVFFVERLFPNMRNLNISSTKITDNGIFKVANNFLATKLMDLNISRCPNITDKSFEWILHSYQDSYLKKIILHDVEITDKILTHPRFHHFRNSIKLSIKNSKKITKNGMKGYKQSFIPLKYQSHSLQKAERETNRFILKGYHFSEELLRFNKLDFSSQAIRDEDVSNLCKSVYLKNIQTLDLSFTNISDESLQSISSCQLLANLKDLNLSSCGELTDRSLYYLIQSQFIKGITRISLSRTPISDKTLFMISVSINFKDLKDIDISECSGVTDKGFIDLLKSLIVKPATIDLSMTSITIAGLELFEKLLEQGLLSHLKEVKFYFCKIKDTGILKKINENFQIHCYI